MNNHKKGYIPVQSIVPLKLYSIWLQKALSMKFKLTNVLKIHLFQALLFLKCSYFFNFSSLTFL